MTKSRPMTLRGELVMPPVHKHMVTAGHGSFARGLIQFPAVQGTIAMYMSPLEDGLCLASRLLYFCTDGCQTPLRCAIASSQS